VKGIIFNVAEKFLREKYGDDSFDLILEQCHLITREPFVDPGTYPDEDLLEIVTQTVNHLQLNDNEFLMELGAFTFHQLAKAYPGFVENHTDPKEFLKTVDSIIHVEIRKLYKDSYLPQFLYKEPTSNTLIITYYSKRKLYDLMGGLIQGVGEYFDHKIVQTREIRNENGRELCDFILTF